MTQSGVETLTPASEAEAAQFVLEARAKRRKLDIVGGGTRGGLGRPPEADAALSSTAQADRHRLLRARGNGDPAGAARERRFARSRR